MPLVKKGRLSVQSVGEDAWKAIQLLAENGGWEDDEATKAPKGRSEFHSSV